MQTVFELIELPVGGETVTEPRVVVNPYELKDTEDKAFVLVLFMV